MVAPAHRRGTYRVRSRQMVRAAQARDAGAARGECEPATCWRDGQTLAAHPAHRDGKRPWWTCGHVDKTHRSPWLLPGAMVIDGRWCAPEVSVCNFTKGAEDGNRARSQTSFRTSRRW